LILSTFASEGTAAYRRISFFIEYLRRRNIKLKCVGGTIFMRDGILRPSDECIAYILPVISSRPSIVSFLINILLSFFIMFYIRFINPLIVIVSVPDYSFLIPSYIGAKLIGARFIVDMRDPPEPSLYYYDILTNKKKSIITISIIKLICKIFYSLCSKSYIVLVVTESLKKTLEQKGVRNVILVPNGADLTLFKEKNKQTSRLLLKIDNDAFVITYIGIIGGYYDISKLIALIRKLRMNSDRKITFLLAGTIADRLHQSLIRSPIFKDIVTYVGKLDREGLIKVLSASDVAVIPRVKSTLFNYAIPTKFYEYVALGLPILALCNTDSELWRIVKENDLGYVCDPEDIVCIEESLRKLMSSDEYQRIKSNVEKFKHKVDREIGARTLFTIIKCIIEKKIK
ncbi:MAG: glycosyltransferase family 4 protein, partial [Desulfurococcaceae archaeon]